MYKFSIIIPCYNEEKDIYRCLNSIFNQTLDKQKYEVIVIDVGSNDNSIDIIKQFDLKLFNFNRYGKIIKVPYNNNYISCFNPYNTYFWYTPRTITTSYSNINERFFNSQIMEWSIHKLPRYTFNESTLKYEEEPEYHDFLFSKRKI